MKKLLAFATAACVTLAAQATTILPGAETSLQSIIDSRVVGTSINVNTDQVVNDAYWTAEQNPAAYLVVEIAGYAADNAFGIYQAGSPSTKIQLFAGSVSGPSGPVTITIPSSWSSFGFYISNTNAGFTWYSDSSLNADGQQDHFVAFQGANGASLTSPNATFDSNDYLLAIEDLNLGDQDYNDMVVLVQNVNPVPDHGTTLVLLGLGLSALYGVRRRIR